MAVSALTRATEPRSSVWEHYPLANRFHSAPVPAHCHSVFARAKSPPRVQEALFVGLCFSPVTYILQRILNSRQILYRRCGATDAAPNPEKLRPRAEHSLHRAAWNGNRLSRFQVPSAVGAVASLAVCPRTVAVRDDSRTPNRSRCGSVQGVLGVALLTYAASASRRCWLWTSRWLGSWVGAHCF